MDRLVDDEDDDELMMFVSELFVGTLSHDTRSNDQNQRSPARSVESPPACLVLLP